VNGDELVQHSSRGLATPIPAERLSGFASSATREEALRSYTVANASPPTGARTDAVSLGDGHMTDAEAKPDVIRSAAMWIPPDPASSGGLLTLRAHRRP